MVTYLDFGIVESHFPMLISLQVFVWSGLVVCLSRLYFLNYNLLGHNNSIPSSLFEENPISWSVRWIMFLHLHDKYLNNYAIMLLPSEISYACFYSNFVVSELATFFITVFWYILFCYAHLLLFFCRDLYVLLALGF